MWGWLYITIFVFAGVMTWAFALRETANVFTAGMAALSWSLLALQPEVTVVGDAGTVAIEVSAVRWLLAALALLSMAALVGSVLGVYPERHPETEFTHE